MAHPQILHRIPEFLVGHPVELLLQQLLILLTSLWVSFLNPVYPAIQLCSLSNRFSTHLGGESISAIGTFTYIPHLKVCFPYKKTIEILFSGFPSKYCCRLPSGLFVDFSITSFLSFNPLSLLLFIFQKFLILFWHIYLITI